MGDFAQPNGQYWDPRNRTCLHFNDGVTRQMPNDKLVRRAGGDQFFSAASIELANYLAFCAKSKRLGKWPMLFISNCWQLTNGLFLSGRIIFEEKTRKKKK